MSYPFTYLITMPFTHTSFIKAIFFAKWLMKLKKFQRDGDGAAIQGLPVFR